MSGYFCLMIVPKPTDLSFKFFIEFICSDLLLSPERSGPSSKGGEFRLRLSLVPPKGLLLTVFEVFDFDYPYNFD